MSLVEDRSAGSLIYSARFHADKSVLDNVVKTDAVLAAELVELINYRSGGELFSVHRDRLALFKAYRYILGLVGSLLGGNSQFKEAGFVVCRLVRGVLKVKTLMRQMPKVFIF